MSDIKDILQTAQKKDALKDLKSQNEFLVTEVRRLNEKVKYYEQAGSVSPKKIVAERKKGKHEATALTLLSDIHYEERITKASTNGLNEYTPDIANRRLKNYFTRLLKLVENNRNDVSIDNLVIGLLGDNIHGFIHDEYLSTNYMSPIVASDAVLGELMSGFQFLLDNGGFKHIKVVCKVGNHSRTTDKIYSGTELVNSYEFFIYKMLQRFFENEDRIEIVVDDSYFSYVEIYGKIIRFEHGHAFKYAGGIGGIYVPLVRHLLRGNKIKPFDLAVMGHWHTFETISSCLINASVCGYNAYSIRKGFDFQVPTQQFQLVDAKYGFTVNTKIFLD